MADLPRLSNDLIQQLRGIFFAKDRSPILGRFNWLGLPLISTPSVNPNGGYYFVYLKEDGNLYGLDSGGNEIQLTGIFSEAIIHDHKTAGTAGGAFNNGAWRTRDLNTTIFSSIEGYSLAANQFILPTGRYIIMVFAPAYNVDHHSARLRNITDGSTQSSGQSSYSSSANNIQINAHIVDSFTITTSKTFEIQHSCWTTQAVDGFGRQMNTTVGVPVEIYTMVYIIKIG